MPWLNISAGTLLTCLYCICGCTPAYQSRQILANLPPDLPPAVELSETPFFAQTSHQCGPAALATILQPYYVDITLESLSKQVYLPARQGSLQIELVATARRYAMLPYPLDPTLSDLLVEIAAGNPVMVLQNLGFGWWPRWHYAVVIGYDIANNELILRSGTTKRWQSTFAAFLNTWKRADNWALVIVPAGTIPATANIATYLKTAYAFEATGLDSEALVAYRVATRQWPDQVNAWLTLGNMAYQTENSEEAVTALLKASNLNPEAVMIWNNLAYALHAKGCTAQALQSLQCAYELSPADENIVDTEQALRNTPQRRLAQHCPQINCDSISR